MLFKKGIQTVAISILRKYGHQFILYALDHENDVAGRQVNTMNDSEKLKIEPRLNTSMVPFECLFGVEENYRE